MGFLFLWNVLFFLTWWATIAPMLFDTIVIGKGLIGSAAAKYLSRTQKYVAAIGPDEPTDVATAVVFSSHYDQARIQRLIGTDAVWTMLNLQSANQYPGLQKESGINFHTKQGCLYVNPAGQDEYLEQAPLLAKQFNIQYKPFENNHLLKRSYPDYAFPALSKAMFEGSPSGYINPRLLIQAQLSAVKKNSGTLINGVAKEIIHNNGIYKITTVQGEVYESKKVLLAPGAFVNFFNLITKKLALILKSETIILARVSEAEANRLSTLPSLLYEITTPELQNIYLIAPVQYPDGKYYIKMGCNTPEDIYFNKLQDIQRWFKDGNSDLQLGKLKKALLNIMPGITIENFITNRCIIAYTKHGKPYIGPVNNNGLFVAAGGNGYSAMCSDALGKVAARLVLDGVFREEYSAAVFKPIFID